MEIDFSGAAQEPGGQVRSVYVWMHGYSSMPMRNSWGLYNDDSEGGIWMSGYLDRDVWEPLNGFGEFNSRVD